MPGFMLLNDGYLRVHVCGHSWCKASAEAAINVDYRDGLSNLLLFLPESGGR